MSRFRSLTIGAAIPTTAGAMFMPLQQELYVVIDLVRKSLHGETTLQLTPTKAILAGAADLRLNCKRQCEVVSVMVNGVPCEHSTEDPLELIVSKDSPQ